MEVANPVAREPDLRPALNPTGRPVSLGMERHLGAVFPVLDHGLVRVVDYMGNDDAIVQAARVSYGRGTKHQNEDRGLIRYLMRHRHSSPFEMCEVKVHVKLPIFVARQWIRHRTASVNEISARYSILDSEFYSPAPEDIAYQSGNNHQGRGEVLDRGAAAEVLTWLRDDAMRSFGTYSALQEKRVARELARIGLPLSTYTQWYWKCNLHNLFHFLGLRADPHAQQEIRVYADLLLDICHAWVPYATEAFVDYRLKAFTLSAQGVDAVRRMLARETVTQETSGMSKREWVELNDILRPVKEESDV